jgi:hypothetical protein
MKSQHFGTIPSLSRVIEPMDPESLAADMTLQDPNRYRTSLSRHTWAQLRAFVYERRPDSFLVNCYIFFESDVRYKWKSESVNVKCNFRRLLLS